MLSAADFELLLQANRILSSKLDPADVLKTVMELAGKVVKAEASSLLLLDEAAQELYFDVAIGEAGESVKQIRLKVGEGIAGWVAKERQPLIVNDVTKDPRFTGKVDKAAKFKTKSLLAVPLMVKGRLIGVVEAINKEKSGTFSAQDLEVFEIFASQSAVAIENARLFYAVTREKEKLNAVFAEMSEGVLLLDMQGRVILMNNAGSRFMGLQPEAIVGKKFGPDLFPGFTSSVPLDNLAAFKDKVTPVDLERREGKDFFVSASILKMSSDKSSEEGYLVILQDDTDEKRGERLKRNFLSLISHKLKTPLTVIVGYGPILTSKMDNLTDFQKKAVEAIALQGTHLSGLVDKLLRFTLVESDSIVRNSGLSPVEPLVKKAVESVTEAEEGQPVKIVVSPEVASAPPVYVDPELTAEVFKNLIENGIKFNKADPKTVRIGARKENGFLRVDVEDNGVGIPVEEKEKVFQKFYQIENSFTGQVPGAGLGLALCKKVVEAMDGEIRLESQIGKGTTVSLFLPLAPAK